MKNCPECGGLVVVFSIAAMNHSYEGIGIRCAETKGGPCQWHQTMGEVIEQLEDLKAECKTVAGWALIPGFLHIAHSGNYRKLAFNVGCRIDQILKGWQKKINEKPKKVPSPACSDCPPRFEERLAALEEQVGNHAGSQRSFGYRVGSSDAC